MSLKIVCSGYLLRYPLGGFSLHHLQYLVGLRRLGHEVIYFEDYGWPDSCYVPETDDVTSNPVYGLKYLTTLLRPQGLDGRWCYLAEDGTAYGMTRDALSAALHECDVYINLSNINWIPELEQCHTRVLIDTDPVFTQIGGHGMYDTLDRHHVLFTYGENVGQSWSGMPTAGKRWLPTRQPIVADLWPVEPGDPAAPVTTVMNWSAYGTFEFQGKLYGQKDAEFRRFMNLPREIKRNMRLAVSAPSEIMQQLGDGGWEHVSPLRATRDLASYQQFIRQSSGEFSVAKQGYVITGCGWFSDRSAGYMASGRPVVVQDTGFSRFLPCGKGLIPFRTPAEAVDGLRCLGDDYEGHCRTARAIVEEFFDARKVLTKLLENCVRV
jgi:hypothetical protein